MNLPILFIAHSCDLELICSDFSEAYDMPEMHSQKDLSSPDGHFGCSNFIDHQREIPCLPSLVIVHAN